MEIQKILGCCDHTLLAQTSTWKQIKGICDDGMKYHTASVCIPPCYVKKAKKHVGDNLKICTVIGFPNGYNTTAVKVYETKRAIKDGADEVDMVINIGLVKSRSWKQVLSEIKAVRKASEGKVLKVIIETCLLTDAEKKKMCEIVTESGADFIKTSTGFSKAGATREDIKLFSENIGPNVKMKAAGGISSIEDAEDFIKLGCERLGTSRIVKIVKENEK